jgi:2,5-dihydroxypyridine 5,6-dioxygenase
MAQSLKLIETWKEVLERCGVTRESSVVVLIGSISHPDNIAAAQLATQRIGGRLLTLDLGEAPTVKIGGESTAYVGPTALSGNRPAVEALKAADMVVDLMGIDRGSEQQEILNAGTRILLAKEPPDTLVRLVPNEEDKRRVSDAAARLKRAKSLHVTSTLGTDMTAALGEYPLLVQYGLADEAGRWDHWPSAFVATWPNEQSATGTVVLGPGDTILPFKQYVREPIRLTVEAGSIRKIEGGFDADYLREYIESFDDIEGYAVSHLGWGLQKRSRWTALGMYDKRQTNGMEARSFDGNFMFSTGPNAEAGGNRHTPCHLDIPMRNCSVFLDGEAVVENGKTLAP